mgnify:CR=1 FL=1
MNERHKEQIFVIVERFCIENGWPFDEKTKDFILDMYGYSASLPGVVYFKYGTDEEGNVTALMVGEITDHPFSEITVATEWFVYSSDGRGKEFMKDFQEWANNHGADVIYATAPTRSVEYWLQSQGYKFKEAAYIKWLA